MQSHERFSIIDRQLSRYFQQLSRYFAELLKCSFHRRQPMFDGRGDSSGDSYGDSCATEGFVLKLTPWNGAGGDVIGRVFLGSRLASCSPPFKKGQG